MPQIADLLMHFDSDEALREAIMAVTLDTRLSSTRMIFFQNGLAYTDASYITQLTFTDLLAPDDALRWTVGTELHSRDTTAGAQSVTVFLPVGVLYWTDPTDDDGLSAWNRRLVLAYHDSLDGLTGFSIEGFTVQGQPDSYRELLHRGRSIGKLA